MADELTQIDVSLLREGDRVRAYLDPFNTLVDWVEGVIVSSDDGLSILVHYDHWTETVNPEWRVPLKDDYWVFIRDAP